MTKNHIFFIVLLCARLSVLHAADTDSKWSRVRMDVIEPASRTEVVHDFPVSVGLVFPPGELTSLPGGRVIDDRGNAVLFEAESTLWWEPDRKNIKWLLLHFRASSDRTYFFERGNALPPVHDGKIATSNTQGILVDTGVLRVKMNSAGNRLFREISLNNKLIARSADDNLILKVDDGAQEIPVHLDDWTASVEESTPMRASIRTSAFWKDAQGEPMARVDSRCQFYRGEAFMRVDHTLTWMVKEVNYRIQELSFGLEPQFDKAREVSFAINGTKPETITASIEKATKVKALQRDGKSFTIFRGNEMLRDGGTLAGSVSMSGADGRSISIALRNAWQRYPMAFRAGAGELRVQFCPEEVPLSFEQKAIMTQPIFDHPCWKRVRQLFKAPAGGTGFYDNYSNQERNGYLYTAEGAAFTHEMLVSFNDGTIGRRVEELNRLAQYPLVLRQDPKLSRDHATRSEQPKVDHPR